MKWYLVTIMHRHGDSLFRETSCSMGRVHHENVANSIGDVLAWVDRKKAEFVCSDFGNRCCWKLELVPEWLEQGLSGIEEIIPIPRGEP